MSRIKCEKCKEVFFGDSSDTLCLPCREKTEKIKKGRMCSNCKADPAVWDDKDRYCSSCGKYEFGHEKVCNECGEKILFLGNTFFDPQQEENVFAHLRCLEKKNAPPPPETIEQKLDTLAEIMTCIGKDIERITDTYIESKMTRKG